MADTCFFLPEEKAARLSAVYGIGKDGKAELVSDPRENAYVKGPRTCYAGGAGLLSTAEDYARFLLMLQSGGEWGGVHILSPKSVELMTADHVGRSLRQPGLRPRLLGDEGARPQRRSGHGRGLRLGRRLSHDLLGGPAEKLVAVFMTQLMPATGSDAQGKFRALVYQSIIESYEKR